MKKLFAALLAALLVLALFATAALAQTRYMEDGDITALYIGGKQPVRQGTGDVENDAAVKNRDRTAASGRPAIEICDSGAVTRLSGKNKVSQAGVDGVMRPDRTGLHFGIGSGVVMNGVSGATPNPVDELKGYITMSFGEDGDPDNLIRLLVKGLGTFEYDGKPHGVTVKLAGELATGDSRILRVLYNGSEKAPVDPGAYVVTCELLLPVELKAVALTLGTITITEKRLPAETEIGTGRVNPGTGDINPIALVGMLLAFAGLAASVGIFLKGARRGKR